RRGERAEAETSGAGEPERILLRARPGYREERADGRVHESELGERGRQERVADPQSGEGAAARWRAGDAESGRGVELAPTDLQSGDGVVLCQLVARVQRLVYLR